MINILPHSSDCCGCGSCAQVCAKHCISFNYDDEGFLYPIVDYENCTNCHLCEIVCPIINQFPERRPLKVLAVKNKSLEERMCSSSGGVFIYLAKKTIKEGGIVFGAKFNEQWLVEHVGISTIKDLLPLLGSKYVQSSTKNTFKEVEVLLKKGKKVLYCGTPCQIAGLNKFLRKEYDNLTTIDFLCHGVPSPLVWNCYLREISSHLPQGSLINDISFRDKSIGWRNYRLSIKSDNQIIYSKSHKDDFYMRGFLYDLFLRPSCYTCKFKRFQSKSNLTIADYWGLYRINPEFNDNLGVSMVFINNDRYLNILSDSNFDIIETTFNDTLSNKGLDTIKKTHKNRNKFFRIFNKDVNMSISSLIEDCLRPSFFEKLKTKIHFIIKK